jgi:hypothetical protein
MRSLPAFDSLTILNISAMPITAIGSRLAMDAISESNRRAEPQVWVLQGLSSYR